MKSIGLPCVVDINRVTCSFLYVSNLSHLTLPINGLVLIGARHHPILENMLLCFQILVDFQCSTKLIPYGSNLSGGGLIYHSDLFLNVNIGVCHADMIYRTGHPV